MGLECYFGYGAALVARKHVLESVALIRKNSAHWGTLNTEGTLTVGTKSNLCDK